LVADKRSSFVYFVEMGLDGWNRRSNFAYFSEIGRIREKTEK